MFSRLFAAATAAGHRSLGLRRETLVAGPWSLRVHRGGRPGGEPWLLLHGLGATSGTFLPLLRNLLPEAEVALPELSELGGTRGPRPAPTVVEAAELVAEVARRCFPGRPPTLAGISLGGWTAVRAQLAHPGLAARLLLVVPGGWRDQDWRRISGMVRFETLEEARVLWRALFVAPHWWMRPARWGLFLAYRSAAVRAILATVREDDAFDGADLARIDVPVGLIWGAEDRLFRAEVGEAMRRALPRATLEAIPAAAHGVQWERPREFVAAVARFRAAFPLPAGAGREQDPERRVPGWPDGRGGGRCPRPTT
ncbi:MAG: alpha/beta hydrolase [Thermoanaerobaculia bacterium]|nr:MAG: alpha/beta hydrolase [Thermoanaerobaculia bacterium]